MLKITIIIKANLVSGNAETELQFEGAADANFIERQIASDIQDSITETLYANSDKLEIKDKVEKIEKEEDYFKFDVVIEEN